MRGLTGRRLTVTVAVVAILLGGASAELGIRSASGRHSTTHRPALAASGESAGADPAGTTTTEAPKSAQMLVAGLGPDQRAVAYAVGPSVPVYPSPGATSPSSRLSNPNDLGAPLVFLVVTAEGDWLQVMLPQRPNGSTGWVQASAVKLYSDDFSVVVHLGARQLDLFQSGKLIDTYPVAVGDASSPTPTGDFYVTELIAASDPNGAYGPYAFGLSGFSNVYTEFDGGPGQIAIHGTDEPWVIGTAASHGCVRLNNAQLVQLVHLLPVGTPVDIAA